MSCTAQLVAHCLCHNRDTVVTLGVRYMPVVEKKDEGTGKMSALASVEMQLKIQVTCDL